jgi:hypothetical protein
MIWSGGPKLRLKKQLGRQKSYFSARLNRLPNAVRTPRRDRGASSVSSDMLWLGDTKQTEVETDENHNGNSRNQAAYVSHGLSFD